MVAADTEQDYLDKVAELASERGVDPKKYEEEAAKRNAPRGTWDQVRSILNGMEEVGMSRFYFQGEFNPDDLELKLSRLI